MRNKLQRYTSMVRLGGIVIIIALLGVVVYQLYDFYSDKVGFTPVKAVESYFNALGQGNYQEVYRLTAKEHLTDIYGRPITKGEFIEQLKKLTGGHRLPFGSVEVTKLVERKGTYYFLVTLHSSVGGTLGESRLLVKVRREDNTWVVTYPFAIML